MEDMHMEKMNVEDADEITGQISASLYRTFSLWVKLLSQLSGPRKREAPLP